MMVNNLQESKVKIRNIDLDQFLNKLPTFSIKDQSFSKVSLNFKYFDLPQDHNLSEIPVLINLKRITNHIYKHCMMKRFTGSRNTSGFSTILQNHNHYNPSRSLPPPTHLTYEGIFNELRFNVGPKTNKILDIHHGYARHQFTQSKVDSDIHDYLALFLKGNSDGEPRDANRRLNSVICLDISGSMNCGLGSKNTKHGSRLSLCIEAIKMFISKLEPEDSIGMTTFDHQAHLIFQPVLKKEMDEGIYERLNQIRANGGNTLIDGFNLSKKLLLERMKIQTGSYENRVIILSDVCDNSITQGINVIKQAASEEDVHLTIVGISTQFNSATCEQLKDTNGFNYFCATSEEDILKYLFETFDFAFFPSNNHVTITLQSDDVQGIEVFGSPDDVKSQNKMEAETTQGQKNSFLVTHIQTCFPSEIEVDKNIVFTVGGLILVKIARKSKGSCFKGNLKVKYADLEGKTYNQDYELCYEFHPEEQFLSDESLREAISGFVFTSELKNLLTRSAGMKQSDIFETYYPIICSLQQLFPQSKSQEYHKIKEIINSYEPKQEIEDQKESVKEETVPFKIQKKCLCGHKL